MPTDPEISALLGDYDPKKAGARYSRKKLEGAAVKALEKKAKNLGVGGRLGQLGRNEKVIVALHLDGKIGQEIAELLDMEVHEVYQVLSDPLVVPIIDGYRGGVYSDIEALKPLVIKTIKDGLGQPAFKVKFDAVDRYIKLLGVEKDNKEGRDERVTITIMQGAREKFVEAIKDASRGMTDVTDLVEEID